MIENSSLEEQEAFVDIVSNTLGIIILLVLILVIINFNEMQTTLFEETPKTRTMDFKSSQQTWLKPLTQKYILIQDKLLSLEMNTILSKIREGIVKTGYDFKTIEGKTEQITFEFRYESIYISRDIDTYELQFTVNQTYIDKLPPFDIQQIDGLIDYPKTQGKTIPFFYVYPSGMEIFVPVFRRLVQNNIDFKWTILSENNHEMNIYRHEIQFERYEIGFY